MISIAGIGIFIVNSLWVFSISIFKQLLTV